MSAAVWQEIQGTDPQAVPPWTHQDRKPAGPAGTAAGRSPEPEPAPRETRVPTAAGAAVGGPGDAAG